MSNITFKQYRNIDLSIFTALTLISEGVATLATGRWFAAQPVAISTTIVFICILMMRWNWFAAIPALVGGVVFCIVSEAGIPQIVIYGLGNCFGLISMLWFKLFKKDEIRKDGFKLVLFVLGTYVSVQLGRWVISLCFGGALWNLVGYLTTDIISLLFALVIMFILRSMDGMIEDQKAYLFRLERQRNEELKAQYYTYGDE